MQYFLSDNELNKMHDGLLVASSIPFIDDVEDYILEAIWEFVKDINGPDPFYNIRSKELYDVVDATSHIGWSIKSLQWNFSPLCEFELVIQRADVYKKASALGFENLNENSDPNIIGAALLEHWKNKVLGDAISQGVTQRRIMILLKSLDKRHFSVFENDLHLYQSSDLRWEWSSAKHNGLKAIRRSDEMCIYRWYPSQKQLFERFILPEQTQTIDIDPIRLSKNQVVDILLPYLEERP